MELTPEAQAVIDAAVAWHEGGRTMPLADAIDAYEASIKPPEPFTRYMGAHSNGWYDSACSTVELWDSSDVDVYEVLITPIRKVR